MENLTKGLLLYELILMILGFILFITLLVLLVIQLNKKRSIKGLLLFFIVPIIMIGFPAIQSFSIGDSIEVVIKKSEEVETDPGNEAKAQELIKILKEVDYKRVEDNPQALTALSNAYTSLGNYDTAEIIINKAIDLDPSNKDAIAAKGDIIDKKRMKAEFEEKVNNMKSQIEAIENNPQTNANQIKIVAEELANIDPPVYVDDKSILTIAQALHVVGEKESAIKILDKAGTEREESDEVLKLRDQIKKDTIPNIGIKPEVKQQLQESQIITNKNALLLMRSTKAKDN